MASEATNLHVSLNGQQQINVLPFTHSQRSYHLFYSYRTPRSEQSTLRANTQTQPPTKNPSIALRHQAPLHSAPNITTEPEKRPPQTPLMAHSKRNTSLPHFTSYERGLLRSTWGTKRTVIGRDSFLPFASCRLCLQPARSPVVACASHGDLFCRECAINDLLAQRQEIKRLEREREDAKKRLAEDEERALEEARRRELRDFELVSMGLESGSGNGNGSGKKRKAGEAEEALAAFKRREVEVGDGVRKKVIELDEEEMARVAREEQERLKKELKREKVRLVPLTWIGSGSYLAFANWRSRSRANRHCPLSGFRH